VIPPAETSPTHLAVPGAVQMGMQARVGAIAVGGASFDDAKASCCFRGPAQDRSFSEQGLQPEDSKGEIEFKAVSFAYPTAMEHTVCRELSLLFPAGTTTAVCVWAVGEREVDSDSVGELPWGSGSTIHDHPNPCSPSLC